MILVALIIVFYNLISSQHFTFACSTNSYISSRYHRHHFRDTSSFNHPRRSSWVMSSEPTTDSNNNSNTNRIVTLTGKSLWKLNLKLQQNGFKDVDVELKVRFIPDRNYEPPQGRVYIESDYKGIVRVTEKGYSGVWTLSEDKNDRKDGLWVWGLFEEPKYPYLYFYLDVFDSIMLPSGEEEPLFGSKGIPNNRLSLRFSHVVEKGRGTTLTKGEMTYKVTELMKADPLGIGGQVDVGDEVNAGTVNIVCLLNEA